MIIGDTLRKIGICQILYDLSERLVVETFEDAKEFYESMPDRFDLVLIDDTNYILYGESLRARRYRVLPLLREDPKGNSLKREGGESEYLCTAWSKGMLENVLKQHLESREKLRNSTVDKGLSAREVDVLTEVARGLTNKEIADKLNISMNTVMSHRKNITSKLNIKTVSGLTFYALMNGLVSGEEMVAKGLE